MKLVDKKPRNESQNFLINSSYESFKDRQKNVFDQLDIERDSKILQSNSNTFMDTDEPIDTVIKPEKKIDIKNFQGKESIFKRPLARPPKHIANRRTPDYQMNPHKWTKYSLDVPNEDLTESANTAAAMSFLKELEERKQNDDLVDVEPQKIMFKKRFSKDIVNEGEGTSKSFQNSKVVMPEYVVGQKVKKELKRKEKKIGNTNSMKGIKLDHLLEYDDD